MKYGKCKCGHIQYWNSGMPYPTCRPCPKCGTIPAGGPNSHPEPTEHDWRASDVETDNGPQPLSRCMRCMMTKAQLAKEEAYINGKKES